MLGLKLADTAPRMMLARTSRFRLSEAPWPVLDGVLLATRHLILGALIIRIGFGGPLNYSYNKEPPKIVLVIIKAPMLYQLQPGQP